MKSEKNTAEASLSPEEDTVPDDLVDNDPWFIIREGFNPNMERIIETILSFSNGFIGARNNLEEFYDLSEPAFFVAGVYREVDAFHKEELAKLPDWTRIQVFLDDNMINLFDTEILHHRRYLDLKRGLVVREWTSRDTLGRITDIKIIKFISLTNKQEAYKSITIRAKNYSGKVQVIAGIDGSNISSDVSIPEGEKTTLEMKTTDGTKSVVINQKSKCVEKNITYKKSGSDKMVCEVWEWLGEMDKEYRIESLITIHSSLEGMDPLEQMKEYVKKINEEYYITCMESHVQSWKKRWNNSGITIKEDKQAQKWVNFALYHLIRSGEFSGNYYSIDARALSGYTYRGHIFWETELYLLPYYIFTAPEIARALLMYRFNTLNGARENAKREGHEGACFAWESTASGLEMAPTKTISPYNEVIPVYSSLYELHITPDITYAVWQYWQATHDEEFLISYGAEIVLEAARFCAGAFKKGKDDCYHIPDVVGPDEYHERIDDNAYTNMMAQYNLNIALKVADLLKEQHPEKFKSLKEKIKLRDQELVKWKKIRDNVYKGFNADKNLFEQFRGYFDLEYIDLKSYEPRNMSMDVLLGREKIKKSQVIKQPDVLMFLFLLANNFSKEIIKSNYDYYEFRSSHGSSLSPSIHSIVAARLGLTKQAFHYFEQNATIDLDDNMGSAAGGVHIGSNGGTWMAVVMGFAGMYSYDNGLLFDPHMPEQWEEIQFPLCWRNQRIRVTLKKDEIRFEITGDHQVELSVGYKNWRACPPEETYTANYKNEKWQWNN